MTTQRIKIGARVSALTTTSKGEYRAGKMVKRHATPKGDWLEIKPDDGGKNFKTRESCVIPA